jgi:hypothetical protein
MQAHRCCTIRDPYSSKLAHEFAAENFTDALPSYKATLIEWHADTQTEAPSGMDGASLSNALR